MAIYSFIRLEDENFGIYYTFSTPTLFYTVYFNDKIYADLVDGYDYLTKSYSFGFFSKAITPGQKRGLDEGIRNTIIRIVSHFLETSPPETVILFHCDITDNRQYSRHLTFKKWFDTSEAREALRMQSIEVEIRGIKNYLGHITHSENPNERYLNEVFEELATQIVLDQK